MRSPFSDALFHLVDIEETNVLSFSNFIQILGTYCMFSKDDILRFAFMAFDENGNDTIDEKEFVMCCEGINNADPSFPACETWHFEQVLSDFVRFFLACSLVHGFHSISG